MATGPRATTSTAPSGGERSTSSRYLLVVSEQSLHTWPLPVSGTISVGRDADCDLLLAHNEISRRHAVLHVRDGVFVEDLGSRNGIRIGGRKLEPNERALLPIGESVRIGPFTAVLLSGQPAPSGASGELPRAAVTVRDPTRDGASELVARVAKHDINVLIQGETGAGKEVLARTIHELSGRPGELVAINCAALTGMLLESELFGHEQGAFTGATRMKRGLLEVAGAGSALLDEVGELPLELQAKLLRALESRQVYRVGGVTPVELAVRVIAATHKRLPDEIAAGRFRQDLYFRLNGITLEIPPLRERRSQIPALARGFLAEAARGRTPAPRLSPRAMVALTEYSWPGNVRELRLAIERALLLAPGGEIDARHLLLSAAVAPRPAAAPPAPAAPELDERTRFVDVATRQRGNVTEIARALRTSRSQVHRLAARFGVDLRALRRGR